MAEGIAEAPQIQAGVPPMGSRLAGAGAVRGALRVEVGTSSPILEAGRSFSILVTIQNPFDVPVEITAVTMVSPVEFVDVERRNYENERKRAILKAQKLADEMLADLSPAKKTPPGVKRILDQANVLLDLIPGAGALGGLARVAYDVSQVIVASNAAGPNTAGIGSSVDIERITREIANAASSKGEDRLIAFQHTMDTVKRELERAERTRSSPYSLHPSNSNVHVFILQTNRNLFFPPSTYEIPIQIQYMIGDIKNIDSIKYGISIRSPLKAVISGSVVGSIAGFLLKDVFEERAFIGILNGGGLSAFIVWLVALLGNVVLAIVVVVAFARKRDTQPFISVEDFWGGLFVGAVAGYTGKSMIHGLLSTGKT